MKITDIADFVNKHLKQYGDTEVMNFKLVDETGGHEWFMYSKNKVDHLTKIPKKMTSREFVQHLKSNNRTSQD